jgi:PKD repeat protein
MNIITRTGRNTVRAAAFVGAMAAVAGCGIEKQSAPALAGPSEFGLSIEMRAVPDTIVQDGESQSAITMIARDSEGRRKPNVTLQMSASSSDGNIRAFNFTEQSVVTNANGEATVGFVAPPPPATIPTNAPVIFVNATPLGDNFVNATPRPVEVRLLPPAGTPLPNLNPTPVILADPRVANFNETIRFDGSLTTDEGQACGSRCTYIWEFGDNTIAVRGITAEHQFALPGTYTVTLTVTDDRGGVGTTTVSIRIIGPTAPIANFTVAPSSPQVNALVTFNGSTSSVGQGASINSYEWDFGDSTATVATSSPTTTHTFTSVGAFPVTLTVVDSLGRRASRSATVTVVP